MISLPNPSYFLYDTIKLVQFYIYYYFGPPIHKILVLLLVTGSNLNLPLKKKKKTFLSASNNLSLKICCEHNISHLCIEKIYLQHSLEKTSPSLLRGG